MAEAEAEKEKVRELQAKRSTMPARNWFDARFRRLLFCRYADDFLIGVIGSKADAQEIMQQVASFLRNRLKLESVGRKEQGEQGVGWSRVPRLSRVHREW